MSYDEQVALSKLMTHIAKVVLARRMLLKPAFQDYDRHRLGRVQTSRFRAILSGQAFTSHFKLTGDDWGILLKAFETQGGVNYIAFLQEITRREHALTEQSSSLTSTISFDSQGQPLIKTNYAPVGGPKGSGNTNTYTTSAYTKMSEESKEGTASASSSSSSSFRVSTPLKSSGGVSVSASVSAASRVELMNRFRTNALQNRYVLNLRDLFANFDSLKKGFVSAAQFARCLSVGHVPASKEEVQVLTEEYRVDSERFPQFAGHVNYDRFCDELEEAYTQKHLHTAPSKSAEDPTKATLAATHSTPTVTNTDLESLGELLKTFAAHARKRRMLVRTEFYDHDMHNKGCIAANRFHSVVRAMGLSLSASDIEVLAKYYKKDGDRVDYMKFSADVEATQV